MSILLLGGNGQVGWELHRALPAHTALDRTALDVSDLDALRAAIRAHKPRILINATAYTAVDKAESEPALADRINHLAVTAMAEEMQALAGWLIHYSTDYVFPGIGEAPYREDDATHPINAYGMSKWRGEEAIRASHVQHLILRTSWVYGEHGNNFPKTILKLAREREALRIVADQYGAPTHAALISHCTISMLQQLAQQKSGTYHVVADGVTSWHGFAQYLVAQAMAKGASFASMAANIAPIASADYPTPAKRPQNSRLAHGKLTQAFGITLPHWQEHADRFIQHYVESL